MPRGVIPAIVAIVLGLAGTAGAQIDPEPRANLELGAAGPLRGDGGVSGYAFLLWNHPHFLDEDHYLRIIFAPTYLMSELVRDRWPAEGHAVGLGLAGGFFPYNVDEFRDGRHLEHESFWGHGGDATLSYYRHTKIADLLPLEGQLRLRPQYVVYQRNGTDPRFRLPPDTPIYSGRAGLRLGGVPPELLPDLAVEASIWYEPSYRDRAQPYGFPDRPQPLEHFTQKTWGRMGGIYTFDGSQAVKLFVTGGTADGVDGLSSFRMGSSLPFRSEFPLIIHGYDVEEVFARRFWLVNFAYRVPLTSRLNVQLSADYAEVDYEPRHRLPRHGLRGVGADVDLALTRRLTLMLGYGYGPDAPRDHGFGGHEAHVMLEVKF